MGRVALGKEARLLTNVMGLLQDHDRAHVLVGRGDLDGFGAVGYEPSRRGADPCRASSSFTVLSRLISPPFFFIIRVALFIVPLPPSSRFSLMLRG